MFNGMYGIYMMIYVCGGFGRNLLKDILHSFEKNPPKYLMECMGYMM